MLKLFSPYRTKINLAMSGLMALILAACSSAPQVAKKPTTSHKYFNDNQQLNRFLGSIDNEIHNIWGVDEIFYKATELIRYSDNYLVRTKIDFANGYFNFETVDAAKYQQVLRNEIVSTLLSAQVPEDGQLYNADFVQAPKGKPYFYNQVIDAQGRSMDTIQEAVKFANQLVTHNLHTRQLANGKTAYYVHLNMVSNHLANRAKIYHPLASKYAVKFGVDPRLVMAIMETESAFNPNARSRSGAIGLMQIIPRTAGVDAYKLIGGSGTPSEKYLYNPEHNIEMGVAYIFIMQKYYFSGITDPVKLRYMLTSSYNAGPGGTLRMFDQNRTLAIQKINKMSAAQLYKFLNTQHYSDEAKRYIYKVSTAYQKY